VGDKTFAERLAALEALVEQAEEAELAKRPPALETLSDDDAIWWAVCAWRAGAMNDGLYNVGATKILFHSAALRSSIPFYDEWTAFYNALGARVNAMIAASGEPFVPLYGWEIDDAIALIDSGRVDVVPLHPAAHPLMPSSFYSLRLDRGFTKASTNEEYDTIRSVYKAKYLLGRQLAYPDAGDKAWEMMTLAEWRAWLVSLLSDTPTT
jgi:hypothetical protein